MNTKIAVNPEDVFLKTLQPKGVVFLSILVLEGPNILKFIAPPSFMNAYLEKGLYNNDPTLILDQPVLGFYRWERFLFGQKIINLIHQESGATFCESMVLISENKRLVLTVGSKKELSLAQWFFEEKPNFDYLLS
ncbi:MAG: hypothetical protein FJX18_00635 [Alphaproteobacteria bacterium]|nr:hypothetical protein [Alphaproteobacteria bacterium]